MAPARPRSRVDHRDAFRTIFCLGCSVRATVDDAAGVSRAPGERASTQFNHAPRQPQVTLRTCGRIVYYETADEAAAAIARFRAASADAQKAMISKELKCCKCGRLFRGRSRKAVKERLKAHEETCTPASTL